MKNKSYTIFETFVGAGGSHIGFKKHGFRSVYVNDFDKNFLKTLVYNNPEIKKTAYIDDSDIIAINNSKLFKKLGYRKNEIDVFLVELSVRVLVSLEKDLQMMKETIFIINS